ncbi:nucleotidyl transferase AbiEii/AbiGii toxin family protein [Jidongwangia harbinensis]|uniref:nucleotidyl transferase AbiEii/AbiGii toxin family protein n=1 Tax=Jidongwangia harbinensis TaxID=2878561 RepID=UPI001CD95243|nr:nucleotidyl transferase AbiEii/AbiGii toxin family protein [Jidongwangia harbinensis]MCA2215630.1 nucleotidyl transferase AbiEii/AbiGii toxin family protein [Jidongwangia harbinensis]
MDPLHRRLAEIALRAAGSDYGLALAGGYAVRAHGMGDRPSGDVDLFTDWQRRADFPAVADLVIKALADNGFQVDVDARADTFARLLVTPNDEPGIEPQKVELAADWRAHSPVTLSIGPVLHPDDAVGNKVAALYGRALARDFLDIDAVLASGRYSGEQLLELAETADPGFDRTMFAAALGALSQISDAAFAPYGADASTIQRLRQRFADWRNALNQQ